MCGLQSTCNPMCLKWKIPCSHNLTSDLSDTRPCSFTCDPPEGQVHTCLGARSLPSGPQPPAGPVAAAERGGPSSRSAQCQLYTYMHSAHITIGVYEEGRERHACSSHFASLLCKNNRRGEKFDFWGIENASLLSSTSEGRKPVRDASSVGFL